ncbi:major facilitator superfamily domain-containing protein [Delphinella strobiligena]|nr:major facilitator superfamily domain-containing protein [Delphinella strobiligena]
MAEISKTPLAVDGSLPVSPRQDRVPIDPALERCILRKLNFQVVPILCFLFFIFFVDRGNIGMLRMEGNDYNIAVMLSTVSDIIFGLPANIIFNQTGPKSLSVMMFLWGICVICEGVVETPGQLKAIRFIVGIFESGFVPAFYDLSTSVLSANSSKLLATLFSLMKGVGGYSGWRWIFIMEGIITVVTTRSSPEEKSAILARVAEDGVEKDHVPAWEHALEARKDRNVLLVVLIYFGAEQNASGTVSFQPTVLKGLGYPSTSAQVHSIPIYITAWVLVFFFTCGCLITTIGLAIDIAQPKQADVKYLGLFFLTAGNYIVMPITVVWLAINIQKGYKRAAALSIIIPVGNSSAICSSNVIITSESPVFNTGIATGLGMSMLSLFAMTVLYLDLRLQNKRKDQASYDSNLHINNPMMWQL